MIIKVQNETPFQVLSNSFTIGPSTTGYELQVGATSRDFTTLFTVAANTPRMVTNVANGSYFRLKNNSGEVEVNWSRTCKDEGGGSGSGSTVSVNQILSAGTQIASITVDNNTTMLYAPEGGSSDILEPVEEFPVSAETGTLVTKVETGSPGYWEDGEDYKKIFHPNTAWTGTTPLTIASGYEWYEDSLRPFEIKIFYDANEEVCGSLVYRTYVVGYDPFNDVCYYEENGFVYPTDEEANYAYKEAVQDIEGEYCLVIWKEDTNEGVSVENDMVFTDPVIQTLNTYQFDGENWKNITNPRVLLPAESLPIDPEEGTLVTLPSLQIVNWEESGVSTLLGTVADRNMIFPASLDNERDINFLIFNFFGGSCLTLRKNYSDNYATLKYWDSPEDIKDDSYIWELPQGGGPEITNTIENGNSAFTAEVSYSQDGNLITLTCYSDYGEPEQAEAYIFYIGGYGEPWQNSQIIQYSEDGLIGRGWFPIGLYTKYDIIDNVLPDYTPTSDFATINGSAITNGGNLVIQGGGSNVVELTQAQYDALVDKDPDTTYIISDAQSINMDDYASQADLTTLSGSVGNMGTALAGKADKANVTASQGIPIWNAQGIIIGSTTNLAATRWIYVNGNDSWAIVSNDGGSKSYFIPTTSGNAGQPLLSGGWGAPVWGTYKFAFITQTDYDALTTPDSTTIYFIIGD